MEDNLIGRRKFIGNTTKAGVALGIGASALAPLFSISQAPNLWTPSYAQGTLPYGYDALEPIIDKETMNIHYTKHAAAYAKNLKEATTAENVDTAKVSLPMLLSGISKYTPKMRNNAGGHYNHELFWVLMTPGGDKQPNATLLAAITKDFGSFDTFKKQFEEAAKTRFGSGWAWLSKTKDGKLVISSTPNQDNPLMDIAETKGTPLLGIDVWEHAYYLKYQNRRPEYITNWWNVVNWTEVAKRFKNI